ALPQLAAVVGQIPPSTVSFLEGQTFFPNAIAPAFISSLDLAFYFGAALSIAAAVASLLRGKRSPQRTDEPSPPVGGQTRGEDEVGRPAIETS
ncbi:MAG: hypothetical protein ABSF83_12100, partial [Nitrososphaerales archaeon]